MAKEGYDGVWDWFGFNSDVSPDGIIRQVDLNVSSLVNDFIMKEKPKEKPIVLISVGRKGAHLFSGYSTAFFEANFLTFNFISTKTLNMYLSGKRQPNVLSNPVILVADTIHTGSEMKKLLGELKAAKLEVKKVFCYLKNEAGLNELVEKKLISNEQVVGLFSSASEEEYIRQAARLHVFFRSKIEPLDPNLAYDLFNANKLLSPREFINIIKPVVLEKFDPKAKFKIESQQGFASNVREIWLTIYKSPRMEEIISKLFNQNLKFDIRCLTVDIKILQKAIDCDFTIIPKTHIVCTPKEKHDATECLTSPTECLLDRSAEAKNRPEWSKAICPWCIEKTVAEKFLAEVETIAIQAFKDAGIELTSKFGYRVQVE